MPTYEYVCDTADCGGTVTLRVPVKDKPDVVQCPNCGVVMEQNFSAPGISFKGQGWTPKFGPQ